MGRSGSGVFRTRVRASEPTWTKVFPITHALIVQHVQSCRFLIADMDACMLVVVVVVVVLFQKAS